VIANLQRQTNEFGGVLPEHSLYNNAPESRERSPEGTDRSDRMPDDCRRVAVSNADPAPKRIDLAPAIFQLERECKNARATVFVPHRLQI
jgi:hypothetical protein